MSIGGIIREILLEPNFKKSREGCRQCYCPRNLKKNSRRNIFKILEI